MRVAKIIENDTVDSPEGIAVSLWVQGCPHRCPGCHNQETWAFSGEEVDAGQVAEAVVELLGKNGVKRNFSVLGGEPLCPENINGVLLVLEKVKKYFPDIKTAVWTGYSFEELDRKDLVNIDILIDGRYIQEQRDITLWLRGSANQRILYKGKDF